MRLETKGLTRVDSRASPREDGVVKVLSEKEEEQCSTSSYSSIGKNSDVSSERSMAEDEHDSEENEVDSAYKYNGPLHAMETLEQVLPISNGRWPPPDDTCAGSVPTTDAPPCSISPPLRPPPLVGTYFSPLISAPASRGCRLLLVPSCLQQCSCGSAPTTLAPP